MKDLFQKILDNGYRFNRYFVLMTIDAFAMALMYFIALLARFNFSIDSIPPYYLKGYQTVIIPIVLVGVACLWFSKSYRIIWRFASTVDLTRLFNAFAVQQILIAICVVALKISMPRTFWIIGAAFEFGGICLVHFSYRFLSDVNMSKIGDSSSESSRIRIMIIGAGSAGRVLLREMRQNPALCMQPVCFIDDNSHVKNRTIEGVPIVGNRYDIVSAVKKYDVDQIIFAIPSAGEKTRKEVLNLCQQVPCKVKTVPGIYQLVDDQISLSKLREVTLEDLLGRDPIKINNEALHQFVAGKTVMVTGGGGSIGSELCRQLAADDLKQLIIFDIYENNAYEIEQELKRKYPSLDLVTLIGSVRDIDRVNDVFDTYHPDIVYHAAAHKHVPLMEVSPHEAIKNNVFGTYNVARSALEHKTQRFVLISTDKAVNPTNIMGASKRLCEMVVQMMDRKSLALGPDFPTKYSAVRFGNVLGSNGSVIPLFKKQIKEGGPVTVTDKRVVRYFMTIAEAVSLVLESSYYAEGGEIFVLDMGKPVCIDDMARKLIRLSGYEPDVDIDVVYTGLRPGEKLYEEMLMNEEGLKETKNRLIHIGEPIVMDDKRFEQELNVLREVCHDEDSDIVAAVSAMVSTYHPELGAHPTKA